MTAQNVCIGLFGTCGGSKWRDSFMATYQERGIEFFNPQVDDWKPELAEIEADHLVNDQIILFPVTNETYGMGSLAESGFSIMQAIRSNSNRFVVILIDKTVSESLQTADPVLSKESSRSRALTLAHLKKVNHPNVFFVETLDDMLAISIELHEIASRLNVIQSKCIKH